MYLYPCRVVVGPASSTVQYKSNYYSAWVKIHGIALVDLQLYYVLVDLQLYYHT